MIRRGAVGLAEAALAPTLAVFRAEHREYAHFAHLPDAFLLHEAVVVDVDFPMGLLLGRVADQSQLDAADMRLDAVRRDAGDRVELQPVVEHAFGEACRALALQHLAHTFGAVEHADAAEFVDAVGSEQIGGIVPHASADVVAIDRLQIARQVLVVQRLGAPLQLFERGLGGRRGANRRGHGRAGLIGVEMERRDRDVLALPVGPAGLVSAFILRQEIQRLDLPDAVLLHIDILEDATLDAGRALAVGHHQEPVPAALGRVAVHREIDDGLLDQLGMDRTGFQALLAIAILAGEEITDRFCAVGLVVAPDIDGVGERTDPPSRSTVRTGHIARSCAAGF